MKIKIILVAAEGEARQAYLSALEPFGVEVDVVPSFKKLRQELSKTHYNGVMVDIRTKIKWMREDTELAYKILDKYPLVQVKFEKKTNGKETN